MAIDRSEGRGKRGRWVKVIALVATREYVLKDSSFLVSTKWVKHVAELEKHEKSRYLHLLPKRFKSVKPYLTHVKTFSSVEPCNNLIKQLKPIVVLVDDKLYSSIDYPRKIREGKIRERHRRRLVMLTDNVAYYTYWCTAILGRPEKAWELDC